ncbi:unnamed protein product, partial [Mycena citricolor]
PSQACAISRDFRSECSIIQVTIDEKQDTISKKTLPSPVDTDLGAQPTRAERALPTFGSSGAAYSLAQNSALYSGKQPRLWHTCPNPTRSAARGGTNCAYRASSALSWWCQPKRCVIRWTWTSTPIPTFLSPMVRN